ncbi:MAG: PilT protein domain protein [Solirubrobacterales bacterium]|nr:PilT protein domain protein [Solirubrobacterales bacterium]
MITAVDTSVLLDVLDPDPRFGPGSAAVLRASEAQGRLIACDVVWAETAAAFASTDAAGDALERLRLSFSPLDLAACLRAATSWRAYRDAGGSCTRMVADFLIGAHASAHADRLLTRDRGFYRSYFDGLEILDPTA